MFNKKKIMELEVRVDALAKRVTDLIERSKEQDREIESLKETVNMLAISATVVQFGVNEEMHEEMFDNVTAEQAALMRKMEEHYNKRLSKFVRSVVNKKKPKAHGKESIVISRDESQM